MKLSLLAAFAAFALQTIHSHTLRGEDHREHRLAKTTASGDGEGGKGKMQKKDKKDESKMQKKGKKDMSKMQKKGKKGMSKGSSSSDDDRLLEAKVLHAFSRFEAGRTAIVERVVTESSIMKREEWEAILAPTVADLVFTKADMAALVAQQASDIQDAKKWAQNDSVISLDVIRGDPVKVKEFCANMPRAAILHVHPSGTRNLQTIQEMLAELDPIVNGADILAMANSPDEKFTMLYPGEVTTLEALPVQKYSEFDDAGKSIVEELFFLPVEPCCHDFKRFEALFQIAIILLEQDNSKDAYVTEKTYVDFAMRAETLGLTYVEFTKVQIPATRGKLDEFAQLAAIVESQTNMKVNFNYAFVRTIDAESNGNWVNDLIGLVAELPEDTLKGIDLLANEQTTPALETGQTIYVPVLAAREAGTIDLKSTMHSGELGDVRNVRDAMIMGATRIGHGVLLQEDPVALEYARKMGVGTVCSLVSNRLLKVWLDYGTHPFLNYLRLGLPVSLSTDDEGMFRTNIANECEIVVGETDIQYTELVALSANAVVESFADDATKEGLLTKLAKELTAFEEAWV